MLVRPAGLHKGHAEPSVFRKAIGEDAASRASADNHVIEKLGGITRSGSFLRAHLSALPLAHTATMAPVLGRATYLAR